VSEYTILGLTTKPELTDKKLLEVDVGTCNNATNAQQRQRKMNNNCNVTEL